MKITQLLGLPDTLTRPNAYDVLGLPHGESNEVAIRDAVARAQSRLRQLRPQAPADVWEKGAKAVEQARVLLNDPKRKADYDMKLGFATSGKPSGYVMDDAFAKWLPRGDAAAPFDIMAYSQRVTEDGSRFAPQPATTLWDESSEDEDGEPEYEHHSAPTYSSNPGFVNEPAAAVPRVSRPSAVRRRKGPGLLPALVGLFALGMLGGIGYCIHLLVNKPGTQVAQGNGPQANGGPRATPGSGKRDRVMGDLAGPADDDAPATPSNFQMGVGVPDPQLPPLPSQNSQASSDQPEMQPSMNPSMQPNPEMQPNPNAPDGVPIPANIPNPTPEPTPSPTPEPAPSPTPSPTPEPAPPAAPTPEQMAEGVKVIEGLRREIISKRWHLPEAEIEKAKAVLVAEEHKLEAEGLERIVLFARQYDSFVREGAKGMEPTQSVEIAPGLPMVMVEVTDTQMVVRAQGKNRTYDLDDLPQLVADALAKLKADKSHPTTIAYRAAYMALSKRTSPEQREEVKGLWNSVAADPASEGEVDVKGLNEILDRLFAR